MSGEGGAATTETNEQGELVDKGESPDIELVPVNSTIEVTEPENPKETKPKDPSDNDINSAPGPDDTALHQEQQSIHEHSEDSKQYYKLDDFELEYNVKGLKERFHALVDEYSGFEEDIYEVSERELMDILGNLAIDSYGILLWILCMDQLETERKKIIWDILIFLGMRMPTQCAMDLLMHYSSNMARYSPTDVTQLGKSLVHGSQFPLATCLVLSAFFVDAAKRDLTRDKQLRELSKEYAYRAARILEEIENDYLAVIMLETPSFHDSKSPLEIALENDIIDFLSCNKVSRISNAIWTLPNLMSIDADTASAFALSDFSASDVHAALLEDSYSFYFSSMGYFTVEVVTYLMYLGLFTYLTHLRTPVHASPQWIDYIFWVGNIGYVLGELIELGYDGWSAYMAKWQNWLDMTISFNFILIIIIRVTVTIFGDICGDICNDEDSIVSILYTIIWAFNVVILWLRLLHFMMLSRAVGPLITNIKNMLKDIKSFGKMYLLVLLGFVFGLYFLIGGSEGNVLFADVSKSVITLVKTTLGQLEWECVRDLSTDSYTLDGSSSSSNSTAVECQCDYEGGCEYLANTNSARGDLATILLIVFSLLTLVVLFNLLTAMMATTYRMITERSDKEVLSRKVALGVEYDKQTQVMPPPFNMLVLILFVIYSMFDALLLLFTQKFISESYGKKQWKCENCNCLNMMQDEQHNDVMEESLMREIDAYGHHNADIFETEHVCQLCGKLQSSIKAKRRYWRNPRQYSEGDGRWKTFMMGLRELLDIEEKDATAKATATALNCDDEDILDERMIKEDRIKKKDWICGFCRNRIPAGQLGDILTFKGRLFNDDIRVDEDDVDAIQQINPLLCPICYRVVSVRSRIIFIMEIISYYVFLFILYPVVRICLIPIYFFQAMYTWTNVEDDTDDTLLTLDIFSVLQNNNASLEAQRKLREIEELLPSDAPTRALLNPQHKIWKVLRHYQKKRTRIELDKKMDDEVQKTQSYAVEVKQKRKVGEERLLRQKGKIVAQLGVLIDKYWRTRLAASDKHKLETKREQTTLKEIQALKNDIDAYS